MIRELVRVPLAHTESGIGSVLTVSSVPKYYFFKLKIKQNPQVALQLVDGASTL